MRVYKPENDRRLRMSTRIAGIVAGIVLICVAVYIASIYTGLVGGMILLALAFRKTSEINEDGLLVRYWAFFFSYKELWKFSEITDIHKEYAPDHKYMILHFGKGVMVRRLVFSKELVPQVITLAQEKNKDIHISDIEAG